MESDGCCGSVHGLAEQRHRGVDKQRAIWATYTFCPSASVRPNAAIGGACSLISAMRS